MPQTPLTNQTVVGQTNAGVQFAPSVSALPGGGYVIAWLDETRSAIFGQLYNSTGSPVGTEVQISANGASPLFASVSALAGGGFVVAWQNGTFNSADIHAQRYASDGTKLGGEFTVNSNLPNEQLDVRVVGLDNGGFLVTWDNIVSNTYTDVSGRIFNSLGEPIGTDFTLNTNVADSQGIVSVAALPGGGFVATWQSVVPANSTHTVVIGQRFSAAGAKVGSEFQVNVDTTHNPVGNDVARLSDGGFVISWVDPVPSNGGGRIVARHYDASGNAIGGEILIASKASGGFGTTSVTALANGQYLVAWTDQDASDNNVSARAMGANDQPLDLAFDVSSGAPFTSVLTADGVVTLANGNVVFTWDGPSTNTSEDVYHRVFQIGGAAPPPPPQNGGSGPDSLNGTSGDDTLNGLAGNDTLKGMNGNDTLNGGTGADRLEGGAGNDFYYVDNVGDQVIEAAGEGNDRIFASLSYTLAAGASVETLGTTNNAGTTAINLTGNEFANTLYGNDGANTLNGGGGADTMVGRLGNDFYYVDNAGDRVTEAAGQGSDRVFASVSYTLAAGASVETLSTTSNAGTSAINLTGNELANTLFGNNGANILDGKGGADLLAGQLGNDFYYVDHVADRVVEAAGAGADRVFASVSYALGAGVSVETLSTSNNAGTGAINLTGNELANTLYGNAGANLLDGKGGADTMAGLGGNDFYFVDAAGDRAVESAGQGNDRVFAGTSWVLEAGASVETISTSNNAGTTAINLTGNELANTLYGNAGANLLDGKAGNDLLVGLNGADSFAFTTALGAGNVDVISGFSAADDTIRLENAVFTGLAPGALPASAFVVGSAAADADDRIIYNSTTGALLFDADGTGGIAAVQFATLQGAPALSASDFLVI